MAGTQAQVRVLGRADESGGNLGRVSLAAGVIAAFLGIAALKWLDLHSLAFAIAAVVLIAGFAIAAVAWLTKAPSTGRHVSSWDIAGALVFIGFGAAIIGT